MFDCEISSNGPARMGDMPDDQQVDVRWLPLGHLMEYRLYPLSLRPYLMELAAETQPIYLGDIN